LGGGFTAEFSQFLITNVIFAADLTKTVFFENFGLPPPMKKKTNFFFLFLLPNKLLILFNTIKKKKQKNFVCLFFCETSEDKKKFKHQYFEAQTAYVDDASKDPKKIATDIVKGKDSIL
jgi:hypothetical protein